MGRYTDHQASLRGPVTLGGSAPVPDDSPGQPWRGAAECGRPSEQAHSLWADSGLDAGAPGMQQIQAPQPDMVLIVWSHITVMR